MAKLEWREIQDGDDRWWDAYSGKLYIASLNCRPDGWYWTMPIGITEDDRCYKRSEYFVDAKMEVESAWSQWLDSAGLMVKP